jgi:transposase
VVTAQATLFHIAPSRSGQIARELLGENYGGVAGTDRCSAYPWLKHHQNCWSHLLRDFQKILERGDDSYPIGWYLKVQAEYLLMKWARGRDGTLDHFEFLAEFPATQTQIRHWLTLGLTVSSSRTAATCRRPTNSSAERALRHAVIWRRSSHGTQSDHGSRFVERILTVVETGRQQQHPDFDFLREALIAYRAGQPAPSLLPAS